eukprot:3925412-Amphidinium_carterae.1
MEAHDRAPPQSERAAAIAALQAHLRAHAVPVAPYHLRLLDDLLGDDLLADDIDIVQGGMMLRRSYPFAAGCPNQAACSDDRALPEVCLPAINKQITLVFHGTFAPFHLGHLACIWDAKRLLTQHGYEIVTTVVGCTNENQVRKKLGATPLVEQLVSSQVRSRIASALLCDHQVENVRVESAGFRTGDLLSLHVAHISTSMHVHIVGSDVQLKSSPRTIVVLRSESLTHIPESLDEFAMFGVCKQTQALGSSSTAVRRHLAVGCIPVDYKASTLSLLRSIFPQAVFRSPSRGSEAEVTAAKDREQCIPVIPASTATSSAPVQKAMPARRPVHLSSASTAASAMSTTACQATTKPPLKRKRAQLAPRVESVAASSRAPLPRMRPQPLTLDGPLHCHGPPAAVLSEVESAHNELLAGLQCRGTLKLAPPAFAHLGTFFRCVVVPICLLMKIVPHSLARRNLDPTLRVEYSPATAACKPLSLLMEVEQFMELSRALGHLRFIGYYYVALTIENLLLLDKDPDTCRGLAVKDIFLNAAELLSQQILFGNVIFTVTMLDAHHFVCIARASTSVSMGVLAGQVCTVMDSVFRAAQTAPHLHQQRISFSVDLGKCLLAEGGMQQPRTATDSMHRLSGDQSCVGSHPILFRSDAESGDPVADCVQWVLYKSADTVMSAPLANHTLRTLVRLWMVMAAEQRIQVAGVLIGQVAYDWQISVRECVEWLCAVNVSDFYVTIFAYAASCALSIQLAVVDVYGNCADGFLRTRGFGLVRIASSWGVIAPFRDSECILNELSPTVPFFPPSQLVCRDPVPEANESIGHFADGGGAGTHKRKRELSELRTRPIYWPLWQLDTEEETRQLYVSASNNDPQCISIPVSWSQSEMERALACHLAVCTDWLDFTWVNNDVSIEYAWNCPSIASDDGQVLAACFQRMPWHSQSRRTSTQGQEVILGHRASRRRGLTTYTMHHEEEVRALVAAVNTLLPTAVYNAAALVHHTSTPLHRDVMNHPDFDMYLIPQSLTSDAWLWFEASTGATEMQCQDEVLSGSWVPFNRILCFAASLAHQVHAVQQCSCLVLYRTSRTPKVMHIQELVALNFPLSMQELNILAAEEEHPSADEGPSADELDSRPSSELDDLRDQCDVAAAVPHCPNNPSAGAEDTAPSALATGEQRTEAIQLLKKKADGTFRTIMLQVQVGSTVDQGIAVLKRFLQYSASRIMLSRYIPEQQSEVLAGHHILSQRDAPYQVLIKSSREHYSQPVVVKSKSVRGKGAASSRPAIGARITQRSAPPMAEAAADVGLSFAGSAAAPSGSVTSGAEHPRSTSRPPMPSSDFERWVKDKLIKIEQQQDEILTIIRQRSSQVDPPARGSASSCLQPPSTQPKREVIGQRRFVQGGMKRARESSLDAGNLDTTLLPAHSLYAASLRIARLDVTDEHIQDLRASLCAQLQHVHLHDKLLAGHSVDHWAGSHGWLVEEYIAETATQRPGVLSDLWILASTLGTTLWLYGADGVPIVFSHPGRPASALCVRDEVYEVIRTPHAVSRLPALPLLPMTPEFMSENHACDLHTELCCVRRNSMWQKMQSQLTDLHVENISLTLCQHRFLPRHSVHCRVFLAVPAVNSQLHSEYQTDQTMVLCVGAYNRTMSVPAWTSLVRIIMEVDHPDVEWLDTDAIVEQSRTFLYHQIEDVFEGLLETHTRHRQAHFNAIRVLEHALITAPAVFVSCERAHHLPGVFTLPSLICSGSVSGGKDTTWLCGVQLPYCVQSDASDTPTPSCLQPLLLLAREQVPNVRLALHQKFGEVLAEHVAFVQGGGSLVALVFLCGAGRYQKVQHDTVARSALAAFVDDLRALQFHEIPQLLVDHLFFADKKCALAVFQAKSRIQRVRAVVAALQ